MQSSKKYFLVFFVFAGFLSCKSNKEHKNARIFNSRLTDSFPVSNTELNYLLGVQLEGNGLDSFSSIVSSINHSDYKIAKKLLENYSYDTVRHSGFWGINSKSLLNPKFSYLFFRYENALANLPQEEQQLMIVGSAIHEPSLIYEVQSIEYAYVANLNNQDSTAAHDIVMRANKLIVRGKKRIRRIEYLLANAYLDIGNVDSALSIFDILIDEDYYSLPSYKRVIDFLSKTKDSVKMKRYKTDFYNKFPNEPLITEINYKSSTETILLTLQKCTTSNYQRDVIRARTILARHYLVVGQYAAVDSMVDAFFRNFDEMTANDFLIGYQKGVFFDLRMRRLYLQKKFTDMCGFALLSLRENPVVKINNSEDFRQYVKALYIEYTQKESSEFERFFSLNFQDCQ
jgi:hypothetical protein